MTMLMRTVVRPLAGVVITGLLAGATLLPAPASADPSATRKEIYTRLGVDQVRADYVVLVDSSNSMYERDRYGQVRRTLLPFLKGLSSTDRVTLYTFDNQPALRYGGPAGDPAAVVASLPPGPTRDGRTDIGAAIDAALVQLERGDAAEVATVVLVTDGAHDAPLGSAYSDLGSQAWTRLANRARAMTGKTVNAYALPLDTADGAKLLGQVFPRATVLSAGSVQDLGGYLDQAKEATRLGKAANALAGDVGKGMAVRWEVPDRVDLTDGPQPVRAVLRSTTAKVPLTITGLAASSSYGPLIAEASPSVVTLAPGATATVEVTLRWRPGADLLPISRTRQAQANLTLTGTVASPWTAALEPTVPLRIPAALSATTAATTVTADVGHPWVLPATAGGVILTVLILWLLTYRRRHPYMPGVLSVSTVGGDQELARFPLGRRRPLDLRVPGMPGIGTVRGRRSTTTAGGSVEVSYSPDGSDGRRATTLLQPREPLILSGLTFVHQIDDTLRQVP
ncbi:vWA domain-containing protein [Plantactinospora soyae]|uniref:VWFA domain-containing protein n=1 Tax=Plantactinospora soyae TaxID=1544732 RepID=A0A927M0E7_9ACTN|nr:vWA domain-containing protein [Plantactinospora soyae]MBE1484391.1 hypothetical protein [Plantactinospora soyae]